MRAVTKLVAIDIGGTHARFALASVAADGTVSLGDPITLKTADYPGVEAAWHAFAEQVPGAMPRAAAIAIAGPVTGDTVPMTNSPWVLGISAFKETLELDALTVLNDFGAVAH